MLFKCLQLKFKKEYVFTHNVHHCPPSKEAGVNIRFRFNIYTGKVFMDIEENLF
jgi:hypothetical protein